MAFKNLRNSATNDRFQNNVLVFFFRNHIRKRCLMLNFRRINGTIQRFFFLNTASLSRSGDVRHAFLSIYVNKHLMELRYTIIKMCEYISIKMSQVGGQDNIGLCSAGLNATRFIFGGVVLLIPDLYSKGYQYGMPLFSAFSFTKIQNCQFGQKICLHI